MVPSCSNGTLSDSEQRFSADTTPAVSFCYEYFFRGNLGVEIQTLVGQQKIGLEQGGDVGSAWARSPTFSLQYHFNGNGDISPFVGVGLNYTTFLGADGKGAFSSDDVTFKDSVGPAVHAGVDFAICERSACAWTRAGPACAATWTWTAARSARPSSIRSPTASPICCISDPPRPQPAPRAGQP